LIRGSSFDFFTRSDKNFLKPPKPKKASTITYIEEEDTEEEEEEEAEEGESDADADDPGTYPTKTCKYRYF
jgi:hypothetical protein